MLTYKKITLHTLTVLFVTSLASLNQATAQRKISESITLNGADKLVMEFKYPKLVKLRVWDNPTIQLAGTVLINNGKNDDAFVLNKQREGAAMKVTSEIKNQESLPKKTLIHKDGEEYFLDSADPDNPALKALVKKLGSYDYMQRGVLKHIELEVTVPRGLAVEIYTQHGLIEVEEVSGPLLAESKHGGVDIVIDTQGSYGLSAHAKHGEVYANLEKPQTMQPGEPHNWHSWQWQFNGGANKVKVSSRHGNLFLRKR